MKIPHLISCLGVLSAFLSISFGIYILRLNTKLSLYRLFFLLCLASSISAFASGIMFSAENIQILSFWASISVTCCILVNVFNLHFSILFTKNRVNKYITAALYLPAAIIIILNLTSYPVISDYIKRGDFWKFVPANNFTTIFFMLNTSIYVLTMIILFYRKWKSSTLRKERLQMQTIIILCFPLWMILSITDYFLPNFEFYSMLPIGPFGRIIYIFIVWYVLFRYRFMIFIPSVVTDEIIAHIQDMVLILTPQLKVMTANNNCQNILFKDNPGYPGCDLFDFAFKNEEVLLNMTRIIKGEIDNCNCRMHYKSGNDRLITDTYCSRIVDKFGDFIGILVISKENRGIKHFQRMYKLSDRQLEVIELSLSGLGNEEISQRLNISKKTTETHFFNIYNKLGINNRIELYNKVKELNNI